VTLVHSAVAPAALHFVLEALWELAIYWVGGGPKTLHKRELRQIVLFSPLLWNKWQVELKKI
jgi:hypothetical protein